MVAYKIIMYMYVHNKYTFMVFEVELYVKWVYFIIRKGSPSCECRAIDTMPKIHKFACTSFRYSEVRVYSFTVFWYEHHTLRLLLMIYMYIMIYW